MTEKNDDGPALPVINRDEIALMALRLWLTNADLMAFRDPVMQVRVAGVCYGLADAMLATRAKGGGQ